MVKAFIHDGKAFTVKIDALTARITLLGTFVEVPWSDYHTEAELKDFTAWDWWQWATEVGCDEGTIAYSEILEAYVGTHEQDELEAEAVQESRWEADHIRQESRTDIFL